MGVILQPGDIFLTRGTSLQSQLIRFFSRHIGESRTLVNHVGIVVEEGDEYTAMVVEARSRVLRHTMGEAYAGTSHSVAVYRPVTSERLRGYIARSAEEYVGRPYGWLKIGLHALDWALLGAYAFRRLGKMDYYPICSYLVADACADAGVHFGMSKDRAEPDDILDWILYHPTNFECIRTLAPIP